MNKEGIAIEVLLIMQAKYDKLYSIAKGKQMKDHYYNLVQAIDDIIEDIKKDGI